MICGADWARAGRAEASKAEAASASAAAGKNRLEKAGVERFFMSGEVVLFSASLYLKSFRKPARPLQERFRKPSARVFSRPLGRMV